jgi:hypothetical protein
MAGNSGLRVKIAKEAWTTAQKLCCGLAVFSTRFARGDLRCAFTEHLRGVDLCLMMDPFGELITCPIHEGDGASLRLHYDSATKVITAYCDADGDTDGYSWTLMGSFGINGTGGTTSNASWSLSNNPPLGVHVSAFDEKQVVT